MKSLEGVNTVQRFADDPNIGMGGMGGMPGGMSPNNPEGISNGSRSRIAGGQ